MFSLKSFSRTKSSPEKGLSLSGRTQIDCMDRDLRSVNGAKRIIELILSRRNVTKLILGHNALSDDGCVLLFAFLSSPLGRKYPIAEISLNANSIGDRGLTAISAYLIDNTTLIELFLQDNLFTSDSMTVTRFAHAINQSRLRVLSLTTNRALADDFCRLFFPALRSRHLQELHLSAIGLTRHAAPYIADYIASADRCRLHTLKCNGNGLAYSGVRTIIRAIERANSSLTVVELYSNNIASGHDSEDTEDDAGRETQAYNPEAWKDTEKLLKQVLGRNTHLKKETWREALQLLVYSRAVLLRSSKAPFNYDDFANSPASTTSFPFKRLPTEIQLHILSFLSPTLSPSQRARIYTYASSPSTLLPLLPSLSSRSTSFTEPAVFSMCVPDPSVNMGSSGNARASPVWPVNDSANGGCAPGKCMGRRSLLCHLEQRRTSWLDQVGCLAYDPGTETV
ncbi:hypothetical protein J3R30DRAFT_3420358 [Lentinula aciculospora]|uniref:RNI-like protein n=1 Tax=Lentinula aciculospora TaxID=153920 RepID=A0A9W9DWX2_9AGAR|nr:hypothetical protein J3R30DRAFT_3420358 [Lentinula aciculospora]